MYILPQVKTTQKQKTSWHWSGERLGLGRQATRPSQQTRNDGAGHAGFVDFIKFKKKVSLGQVEM